MSGACVSSLSGAPAGTAGGPRGEAAHAVGRARERNDTWEKDGGWL